MVFRAATARVKLPQAGGNLSRLLRGSVDQRPAPSLHELCRRQLTLQLLGPFGLSRSYFNGDFLDGACAALTHFASDVLPAMSVAAPEQCGADGNAISGLEAALARHLNDALTSLQEEELELVWEVEDVSSAALGSPHIVFGMRRSTHARSTDAFQSIFTGQTVVLQGEKRQATLTDYLSSYERGATLAVDVDLTARQNVIVRRRQGETIAGTFNDAARHCLRLEADLVATGEPEQLFGMDLSQLELDIERGWVISDINEWLAGNCVAKEIPKA